MPVTVVLPRALQPYAGGAATLLLEGRYPTLGHALGALGARHPAVIDRVLTEQGAIRTHVNVFVDEESVRQLSGLETPLQDGQTILIVPAVSGG